MHAAMRASREELARREFFLAQAVQPELGTTVEDTSDGNGQPALSRA